MVSLMLGIFFTYQLRLITNLSDQMKYIILEIKHILLLLFVDVVYLVAIISVVGF